MKNLAYINHEKQERGLENVAFPCFPSLNFHGIIFLVSPRRLFHTFEESQIHAVAYQNKMDYVSMSKKPQEKVKVVVTADVARVFDETTIPLAKVKKVCIHQRKLDYYIALQSSQQPAEPS